MANDTTIHALTVRVAIPVALELPCREAADVDMKYVQSGAAAVVAELNLDLQLIPRDGLVAHRADHTNSRPAPRTIGSPGRQLSCADRFSGFRAQKAGSTTYGHHFGAIALVEYCSGSSSSTPTVLTISTSRSPTG
jgi:hypothetical protein